MESQQWGASHYLHSLNTTTASGTAASGDINPPKLLSPADYTSNLFAGPVPHSKYHVQTVFPRCPLHLQHPLECLRPHPRSFIHAWLLLAQALGLSLQSVQANYQPFSTLSIDQLGAIVTLKDLPHDQVLAWYDDDAAYGSYLSFGFLHYMSTHASSNPILVISLANDIPAERAEEDFNRCKHSTATTCRSSTCSSIWTKRSSTRPSSTASSTHHRLLPDIQEKEKRTSKRLRNSTISSLPEVPETEASTSQEPQEPEHACIYKCTRCERSFRSMQTWSRHEKEDHEDISFPCMPDGAIEITIHGRQCALCGQEPTEEHLRTHNIEQCTHSKHVFKRSYELRKHLETHGFAKKSRQSDVLVSKWQRVPDKQAWSCGYCKGLFPSLADFHKHVAVEHYEQGETREWDHTKVILGLLSQDHIAASWERLLAARFKVEALLAGLSCKWSKSRIASLQTRLELGQEPPDVLTEAALDCAKYDRDLLNEASRHMGQLSRESSRSHLADKSGPPVPPKSCSSPPPSQGKNPKYQAEQESTALPAPLTYGTSVVPSHPRFESKNDTDARHHQIPSHDLTTDYIGDIGIDHVNFMDIDIAEQWWFPSQDPLTHLNAQSFNHDGGF
ncbi:MAG: hypothetical protein Q9218_001796 [Villophora microphyllina]